MKRRGAPIDGQRLASDLASLPHLTRDALRERWREVYDTEAPAHLGRDLLIRAVAYRLQEQAQGGLSAAVRRILARAAENGATGRPVQAMPTRQVKPGARLLREWHGVTHEVIVLDEGVLFRGKRHRSLSEVARIITGSRWSGPTFFGLNSVSKDRA
jgi:hypothetical protein